MLSGTLSGMLSGTLLDKLLDKQLDMALDTLLDMTLGMPCANGVHGNEARENAVFAGRANFFSQTRLRG